MPLLFDEFIKNAETIALTMEEVMQICLGKTNMVKYSELPNCQSLFDDNVLGKYHCCILYWETSSRTMGHYTSLIYQSQSNILELYDSYGMNLSQLYDMANTSEELTNHVRYLDILVNKAVSEQNVNFIYNNRRMQRRVDNINTCGRYASLRNRLMNLSLSQFNAFLTHHEMTPDEMVSALTVMFSSDANKLLR
jgi:hypothetical protein